MLLRLAAVAVVAAQCLSMSASVSATPIDVDALKTLISEAGPLITQSTHFGFGTPLPRDNITTMFAFGDSWSSEGWCGKLTSKQIFDSIFTPKTWPNRSTSGGPMWPRRLISQHLNNPKLWNYAVAGASVSNDYFNDLVPSLQDQVRQSTEDFYGAGTSAPALHSLSTRKNHTLHSFSIGGNDNYARYDVPHRKYLLLKDQAALFSSMDRIYRFGGRHFLVVNVPPADKIPLPLEELRGNATKVAMLGRAVDDWNAHLRTQLRIYCETKPDLSCVFFDMNTFIRNLLITYRLLGFKHSTRLCKSYASLDGVYPIDVRQAPCDPLVTYLFLNAPHPTWPVHQLIAEAVYNRLMAPVLGAGTVAAAR